MPPTYPELPVTLLVTLAVLILAVVEPTIPPPYDEVAVTVPVMVALLMVDVVWPAMPPTYWEPFTSPLMRTVVILA